MISRKHDQDIYGRQNTPNGKIEYYREIPRHCNISLYVRKQKCGINMYYRYRYDFHKNYFLLDVSILLYLHKSNSYETLLTFFL